MPAGSLPVAMGLDAGALIARPQLATTLGFGGERAIASFGACFGMSPCSIDAAEGLGAEGAWVCAWLICRSELGMGLGHWESTHGTYWYAGRLKGCLGHGLARYEQRERVGEFAVNAVCKVR